MTVCVAILPTNDLKWPWRVRIVTRDEAGVLVGVRNLRAFTRSEAEKQAEQYRGRNARDDIATEGI